MKCLSDDKIIESVLDQLPNTETDAVLSHVAKCESCRRTFVRYQSLVNFLAGEMPKLTPEDIEELGASAEIADELESDAESDLDIVTERVLVNIRAAIT